MYQHPCIGTSSDGTGYSLHAAALIDEATDRADDKTVLIMARHYDEHKDSVITSFVANPVCPIADARTLFGHLDKLIVDNKIPWSNVMGQSFGSASTMVERHR